MAHTLRQLRAPTAAEVAGARAAWPSLAGGLPRKAGPALRVQVAAAKRRAEALTLPAAVLTEGAVTGPTVRLAGMLKSYVRLAQRGWGYLATALAAQGDQAQPQQGTAVGRGGRGSAAAGSGATARFMRVNAPLYIYCVYDSHYTLSLIGKTLRSAYLKLGGASAFGGALTQNEVETLAQAYSIPAARLQPHPAPSVVV